MQKLADRVGSGQEVVETLRVGSDGLKKISRVGSDRVGVRVRADPTRSHPTVGVAVVGLINNVPVELLKHGTIGKYDEFTSTMVVFRTSA